MPRLANEPLLVLANTPDYWSERFRNNFPLCPTSIRDEMTEERYQAGCATMTRNTFEHYRPLLPAIQPGAFWIFGAGDLDDTREVIDLALALDFTIHVADFSDVVTAKVRQYFRDVLKEPEAAERNVHCVDAIPALASLLYFPPRVIHLSRILDHVTPGQRMEIASLLVQISKKSKEGLRVTVINHDTDDNSGWLERWTTVYPFNIAEFWEIVSGLAGYEIPIVGKSAPWDVFGEVFRAETAQLDGN